MELQEQLKELSEQMELNEKNKQNIMKSSLFQDEKKEALLNADRIGYDISLDFNELLRQNGANASTHKDFTQLSAKKMLSEYGLNYPISWEIDYENRDGIHYKYYGPEKIKSDYESFCESIDWKMQTQEIDDLEYERLQECAKYYFQLRTMTQAYYHGVDYKVI